MTHFLIKILEVGIFMQLKLGKIIRMDIKIDEDTLDRTQYCEKGFSCLGGGEQYLCEVKCPAQYNTLFINPKSDRDCTYCTLFGNSLLCFCPTRNEIYNRYQI